MTPEDRDKDPLFPRIAREEKEQATHSPGVKPTPIPKTDGASTAYPTHVALNDHCNERAGTYGMTIRDHYKIELASAYLSRIDSNVSSRPNEVAKQIARFADALLEA